MGRLRLLAVLALAACGGDADNADTLPEDTASVADVTTADSAPTATRGSLSAARGTIIDARTSNVGDRIAGLRIAEKRIQDAPASPLGVTGSLEFDGEMQVTGGYRAHFDYPEVKAPCFWVDPADWNKVPRVKGDERIRWFCFENDASAIEQLGQLGTETRATIIVDRYTTNLAPSDVWDTARLVRVVEKLKFP